MSTAPSMPASVPVDLLPASAHRLRWDMGDVLRQLVARAAVEQASDDPAHSPTRQLVVLPRTLRGQFARSAVALQQCIAAPIAGHHPEAP
ncbi:hypothetical protein Xgly_02150 [Xanthomonas citri pv. glycines]|uniref:Uncharacterized protein n=2 Tax=Xanthomonas citri TaxID=346 RepID=A0AAX0HUS7_XANCG|nr:hypothetical protein A9D66_03185 [Xanthomonas citri pv. glycines str. 12-2]OEY88336.1 hypothetical protein BIY41_03140 [Xanthomonas citri pv. glycines]OOX01004.1 hypothetical protein Xgly_02150 [Xanthomonas citri pv. glycines]